MLRKMFRAGFGTLRGLGLGAIICLAGCGASNPVSVKPPAINPDWAITVQFNYDFTNFVSCSATVTKGCITGFTWGYTEGGLNVPLKTSPPTICAGTTQPQTCTDTANSTLGIGTWNAYVQANALDNTGAAVKSGVDASPNYTVVLGAATNISATAQ